MADFCADTPGRRAGMAQIFLNDVDDAVAEIKWAREHGLFGGILLPGVPPDSELPPLFATDYDPIWATCADLDMPVNNHSGAAGPAPGAHLASMAIFMVELSWFSHRVFWHMAFGGAFARYPSLKLVLTEQSSGWVPAVVNMLDHQYSRFCDPSTAESHFGGELVKQVTQPPSYYWEHNCFAGASFFRPSEVPLRYDIGVDKIMWGQDYPHIEGTYPVHHRGAAQHVRRTRRLGGRADGRAHRDRRVRLRPRRARAGRREGRADGRGGRGAARAGTGRLALDRVRWRRPQALVT